MATSDPAYPDALPPEYRLHWYVLERVLGQGGFGITYLARDTNLDQRVAIKEYLPIDVATRKLDSTVRPRTDDQTDRYRWGLDRFIREARTLARFDHPNIVRVHSVFEFNSTAYMVMRFEEGENFAALLERRRTLPEPELMRVLMPVLDGLELIHNAGFIHRDIKPDNIHIRADGSPVLLDFGSARASLGQGRTVTILVAPGYAPFEQYYSSGENQGPWTDIYGLGATCYRAISGVPPLDAITRSKGVLGSSREVLVPARTIGSGRYSETVLRGIDHALEFAEKDRPQSIAEWRKEVSQAVATVPQPAPSSPSPAPTSVSPVSAPEHTASPVAATPEQRRGIGTKSAVIATALVVASLGVGAWMWQKNQETERELARFREEQQQRDILARKQEEQRREQQARDDVRKREDEQKRADADYERQRKEDEARVAAAAPKKPEPKIVPVVVKPEPSRPFTQPKGSTTTTLAPPPREPDSKPAPVSPPAPQPGQPIAGPDKGPDKQLDARADPTPAPKPAAPPTFKTDKEEYEYYRDRAGKGDNEARVRVGDMYALGRGVEKSNFNAYIWYGIAAESGSTAARTKQTHIAETLQPMEIQQANRTIKSRTSK